jgi:protein-L-isoaspartate(D-aspartate) O-methyltransferase
VPVGTQGFQDLKIVTREGGEVHTRSGGGCVFVPLLGKEGWSKEGQ